MKKIICVLLSVGLLTVVSGCIIENETGDGTKESSRESVTSDMLENPGEDSGGMTEEDTTDLLPDDTTSESPSENESTAMDTGFPNEAESDGTKRY